MKILVIGSGGREHTLVWKINQSDKVDKIYCAPGNAGIAELAECVDISVDNIEGLVAFAKENLIDLTIVGPEAPLVAGIVDVFEQNDLRVFGASKSAAALEGSKIFAKEFLKKYYIPSADFRIFDNKKDAEDYALKKGVPLVIKADGLAAGKGVYVCQTVEDINNAIDDIFVKNIFGKAGEKIVIEECLTGPELSILVFCDGENVEILESSQDHKRAYDGDKGPNTGGMGTYSPAPLLTPELLQEIKEEIIIPTVYGMKKEGSPYKGILYAGLMITPCGPKVLEFNVRFGDPETQVVLPRMQSDIIDFFEACIDGTLKDKQVKWKDDSAVCVVLSSGGYPGKYEKGKVIFFDDELKKRDDIIVFHAGTEKKGDDIVTSGGRVLGVTALGKDIEDSIDKVYDAVNYVKFDGMFYRKDIAKKSIVV